MLWPNTWQTATVYDFVIKGRGFVLVHSLKVRSIMERTLWRQGCEVAGHIAQAIRKHTSVFGVWHSSLSPFSIRTPRGWCCPHAGCILSFQPNLSGNILIGTLRGMFPWWFFLIQSSWVGSLVVAGTGCCPALYIHSHSPQAIWLPSRALPGRNGPFSDPQRLIWTFGATSLACLSCLPLELASCVWQATHTAVYNSCLSIHHTGCWKGLEISEHSLHQVYAM